jgi:hypothetical protein
VLEVPLERQAAARSGLIGVLGLIGYPIATRIHPRGRINPVVS